MAGLMATTSSYCWTAWALAVAAISAFTCQADVIFDYPNFSSTSGLTLVGNASTTTTSNGTVLRLTSASSFQNGAAYSTTPVTLGPSDTFSTTFEFQFTDTGGIDPADGITFVLAASSSGLGDSGGGLGYEGVANSIAIEFDTYENGGADSSSNHVAIDTGGVLTDTDLTNLYGIATCDTSTNSQAGCMSNGDIWSVTIGYNGTDLSVSAWDTTGEAAPFTVYSSLPISIASDLGTSAAFIGFTGSTGNGWENQDILNWEFANTTQLASTPEPATLVLILAGVAATIAVNERRRRRT